MLTLGQEKVIRQVVTRIKPGLFCYFLVQGFKHLTVNSYILVPNKSTFVFFAGSVGLTFLPIIALLKPQLQHIRKEGEGRTKNTRKLKSKF